MSKVIDKYGDLLKSRAPIAVAQYRNTSGIIGAALHAADQTRDARLRGFAGELRPLNQADRQRRPRRAMRRRSRSHRQVVPRKPAT